MRASKVETSYIMGGRNTQTINVCSKENERGVYQSKLRLPSPKAISQEELVSYRSLREMIESLLSRGATVEDFTNWSAARALASSNLLSITRASAERFANAASRALLWVSK